jgi:hypothetical protein
MRTVTKVGIVVIVIGLSILASTYYRSSSTSSYKVLSTDALAVKPQSWSASPESPSFNTLFLAPRDLRLELQSNTTIDAYLLDSEGLHRWTSDETFYPLWAANGVSQDVFVFQITLRGEYAFVVYNPTNSTAPYELHITLYGFEQDLLWSAIVLTASGLVLVAVSELQSHVSKPKSTYSEEKI